jgi:hypothetical protein
MSEEDLELLITLDDPEDDRKRIIEQKPLLSLS